MYLLILLTTSLNAYSQAYILITLIPVITSFITLIRLSVIRAAFNLMTNLSKRERERERGRERERERERERNLLKQCTSSEHTSARRTRISVGGAPEAYGSQFMCLSVYVCMSLCNSDFSKLATN